jgi:predicted MFS family arabinose efflux permease
MECTMTIVTNPNDIPTNRHTLATSTTILLASACGLLAANLYYAQPLAGPISAAIGLSPQATGLIVTLTQMGYGMGLLLIVPLGDLIENRSLLFMLMGIITVALIGAGLATSAAAFLASALFIGLGSVAVQVLVPYAAHLAPEATRGRVVGNVMSGLMLGIMLARPVSGIIAEFASWHVVFFLSAGVMILLALVLGRTLPKRVPGSKPSYGALLASMGKLALTLPVLRRRALYQACQFGAFSLFWTTTPLLLASPVFHLSQGGIALFALAGVAGAVAAPIAGRVADRGWSRPGTGLGMLAVVVAFLMTHIAREGSTAALGLLVAAAIVLDFGVSATMTLGQRAIFSLGAEYRGRINGIYMATLFAGGALGSAIGGWAFAEGGWPLTSAIGLAFPIAALLYFVTE